MILSIIIVNYNTAKIIINCIDSIYRNTKNINYEIIVVDNASKDDSVNFIKKKYPEIILIENRINNGYANAINQAIRKSNAEYVFILNPDTILINDSIQIFYNYMKENNDIACCGGNLVNMNSDSVISYGNFPSLKQIFFEEFGIRKIFKKYYFRKLSPGCVYNESAISKVDYICGADIFIKKSIFEKTGLFDEDFFLYYEETEFFYRLKKSGYKSVILPEARIIHLEGQSLKNDEFEKLKLKKKSEFLFFKKCHGGFSSFSAKFLYLYGCLLKLIFKLDGTQFKKFKIIFNA